jgi:hypothetical protein
VERRPGLFSIVTITGQRCVLETDALRVLTEDVMTWGGMREKACQGSARQKRSAQGAVPLRTANCLKRVFKCGLYGTVRSSMLGKGYRI